MEGRTGSLAFAGDENRVRGILTAIDLRDAQDRGVPTAAAWAHLALGDTARAITIVRSFTEEAPENGRHILESRRFWAIRDELPMLSASSIGVPDAQRCSRSESARNPDSGNLSLPWLPPFLVSAPLDF